MEHTLEEKLGQFLSMRNISIAVAESCTGGLLGHKITNAAGSSAYFLGGAIVYSNQLKRTMVGVKETTLEKFGAVSEEVGVEMAEGIRRLTGADIGVSISGVAGTEGGTDQKPVGMVWSGYSSAVKTEAVSYLFSGSRIGIKESSANAVLEHAYLFAQEYIDGILASRIHGDQTKSVLKPVEVKAVFSEDGEIKPISIRIAGNEIRVQSKRIRANTPDKIRFMVLLPSDQTRVLELNCRSLDWTLESNGNQHQKFS